MLPTKLKGIKKSIVSKAKLDLPVAQCAFYLRLSNKIWLFKIEVSVVLKRSWNLQI